MARHGLSKTRMYGQWAAMKRRCYNPNVWNYPHYGGRGIAMCDRWRESFLAFREDMGEPPPGAEIDRIDNDGNYEPGNCRWATRKQQMQHYGASRMISIGNITLSLSAWCELSGVRYGKAIQRLNAGWAPHHAILCPTLPKVLINGRRPEDLAKEAGVHVFTIKWRARRGWPADRITSPPLVDAHKAWVTRRKNAGGDK